VRRKYLRADFADLARHTRKTASACLVCQSGIWCAPTITVALDEWGIICLRCAAASHLAARVSKSIEALDDVINFDGSFKLAIRTYTAIGRDKWRQVPVSGQA
jgi:hypothetical protein